MTGEVSYSKSLKLDMIAYRAKNPCCRENTRRAMEAFMPASGIRDADVRAYYGALAAEGGGLAHERKTEITDMSALRCPGCRSALLRGMFLVTGTLTDPSKREANLDLSFSDEEKASSALSLLSSFGFGFRMRNRRGSTVLYLKSAEDIGGFFAEAGINRVLFDVSNAALMSDVANFANRRSNTDIHNLAVSTQASERVCDAIRLIEKEGKSHLLDETLAETARLRLENPELSLSQLAALFPTAVTKSTLANRLRRITAIADGLAEKKPK